MQRRRAVDSARVDVVAPARLFQQRPHRVAIPGLDRVDEANLGAAGAERRDEQQTTRDRAADHEPEPQRHKDTRTQQIARTSSAIVDEFCVLAICVQRFVNLRGSEEVDRPGALAERLDRAAELLRHRQPQVADRRPLRQLDVAMALADAAADGDDRQRVGEMAVRDSPCRRRRRSASDRAASRRRRASSAASPGTWRTCAM